MELGAWRLELTPRASARADDFLTVMQVTDSNGGQRLPVKRLESGDRVGCVLTRHELQYLVLFQRQNRRSTESVRLSLPGLGRLRCLVMDLAAGTWGARCEGKDSFSVFVSEEGGCALLDCAAGDWTMELKK